MDSIFGNKSEGCSRQMDAEIGKAEEQEDEKDGAWMPSSRLFGMSADGTFPFFFFFF